MKTLEPHFDALERDCNVRAVADEVLGENNRLFLEAAKERGHQRDPDAALRPRVQGVGRSASRGARTAPSRG